MRIPQQNPRACRLAAIAIVVGFVSVNPLPAFGVDGSELNASFGLWAPLFPGFQTGGVTDDSDELGGLVELYGHHRFDGYLTSAEGSIFYGDAGDITLFGYEALLRDTWSFAAGDLSAGFGYSQMIFDQTLAGAGLESNFRGAKVVAGWETAFGGRPVWLDLGLGLYDLDGTYSPSAGADQTINDFTTTFSVETKTDLCLWGIAARPSLKIEYLSDLAAFQNNQLVTDDGLILSAMLELRLAGRR